MSKRNPVAQQRIADFEKAVLAASKNFACGGVISSPFALRFPTSPDAVRRFVASAVPASFGRGSEEVFDPEYRQAKAFKPPNTGLSIDIVGTANILDIIANRLAVDGPIKATLNKVNAYETGGFFKAHRDTPLGPKHLGTITVCLPTAFTGGELVVKQDGHTTIFDWDKGAESIDSKDGGSATDNLIRWAFLYSDCEHEVLPVTSGTRITIAYDVWRADKVKALETADMVITAHPLYYMCSAMLADRKAFMPKGGTLAFGGRHAYPEIAEIHPLYLLKGVDLLVKQVASALQLSCEIKFAYDVECYDDENDASGSSESSLAGDEDEQKEGADRGAIVDCKSVGTRYTNSTSRFWNHYDGVYADDSYESEISGDLRVEKQVIWVTDVGAYGKKTSYVSYGNEPDMGTEYVGIALFVTIPPAHER